jgi:predicted restriction endonuclease
MAERNYKDDRYKEFRDAVLKRDCHKCQYPGCRRKKKLQVHHIIRWADSWELRYSVGNGISLCVKHHKLVKNKEHFYSDMFFTIVRAKKK